jgi:surfactin synthase thioesterase subunit
MTDTNSTNKRAANPCFIVPKPNPDASLRLFCFPYAGGGALIFRSWPEYLPAHVEVCGVQPPGRGNRMQESLYTLVEAISKEILPYLDKPFAFFGHSMGAKISFELARILQKERGVGPAHLFVSGCRAPQVPYTDPPTYNLPPQEFIEELRSLNGTPREILENPELMNLMTPVLRADFELVQTYAFLPGPLLNCPLTVLGGLLDKEVTREHLDAWQQQTTAFMRLRMLPGDHFFLHSAQSLLLRILTQELHQLTSHMTAIPFHP